MDSDGSNQHELDIAEVEDDFLGDKAAAIYQAALEEQSWNDARDHKVFVQEAYGHPQIYVLRLQDDHRWGITHQSTMAYDPRWQPGGGWIVFTSPDDGDDEIWRVTNEGERLQQLTRNDWEHDKFPSWSPDGREIVFWSNRLVGYPQIWVMDLDGQQQRNISGNDFNDWDPVWVIGKRGPTVTPTPTATSEEAQASLIAR
jgi:TolB protein